MPTQDDYERAQKEQAQVQTESQAAAAGHQVGLEQQARAISERKQNPRFYDRYTHSSLEDSERWGHLVDDFAALLADDHVLSNRRQVYRLQRELLDKVRAEQSITGATPGVRVRQKPLLGALAQGATVELDRPVPLNAAGQQSIDMSTVPGYTPPMDADERTVVGDIARIATARHAMGVDKAGSEALTTATTESRTVREDETEANGTLASIGGVFD